MSHDEKWILAIGILVGLVIGAIMVIAGILMNEANSGSFVPTATNTPHGDFPVSTFTPTSTITFTPSATATPTITLTPSATFTPVPTVTRTPTPSPTPLDWDIQEGWQDVQVVGELLSGYFITRFGYYRGNTYYLETGLVPVEADYVNAQLMHTVRVRLQSGRVIDVIFRASEISNLNAQALYCPIELVRRYRVWWVNAARPCVFE